MKRIKKRFLVALCCVSMFSTSFTSNLIPVTTAEAARQMENLGRGVVAVRTGYDIFVSWRLLALDPSGISFNVYRSANGGTAVKLNSTPLTGGTNYTDTTANRTVANTYFVKPVINNQEQDASSSYTIAANPANAPYFTVPIKDGSAINNVWVGDFDGDHEYDYLVDRHPDPTVGTQKLEAYKKDGTFLWEIDLGYNSDNRNNIEPGATTISVGHWDGVTVYDLNGDGKAEVILRIADAVVWGDGSKWTNSNKTRQWFAVVDGMTGTLKSYCAMPRDYESDGPLALQLGIGYLNGTTPSVIAVMKNRKSNGDFNMLIGAYKYNGSTLTQQWLWNRNNETTSCSDGHQMRIADVDGDGKDEVCEIGFVLESDGTLKYSMANNQVVHGDRFYIGKFDKNSPLRGYAIQQDNPYGLLDYYYDPSNGNMIWKHTTTPPGWDMGRGTVADIDPRYDGCEVWSFDGIYNAKTHTQITASGTQPWPAIATWWDGDLLAESINDTKLEKWNYLTNGVERLVTLYQHSSAGVNSRGAPMFHGDIMGDWREEIVLVNSSHNQLVIFTTSSSTNTRLYTLAQNPMYRNSMTIKGYTQSHTLDYYLGTGMDTPPTPDIYVTQ